MKACCAATQLYNIPAFESRVALFKHGTFHVLEAVDVETDVFRNKESTEYRQCLVSRFRAPEAEIGRLQKLVLLLEAKFGQPSSSQTSANDPSSPHNILTPPDRIPWPLRLIFRT